jgi:hypothetical protein
MINSNQFASNKETDKKKHSFINQNIKKKKKIINYINKINLKKKNFFQ